jgi:hypothetical protein
MRVKRILLQCNISGRAPVMKPPIRIKNSELFQSIITVYLRLGSSMTAAPATRR